MGGKKTYREIDKITFFSIGAKMVLIITVIVLMSLGSITVLVSWLVREDLRLMAEENNLEINRRSAIEAEYIIGKMRSDSLMLIRILNAVGIQNELGRETTEFFFEQNPQVAALSFSLPRGEDESLINRRFFLSREIEQDLVGSYLERNAASLRRAALGETILLNATPHFGISVAVLFFPWQNGGGAVLFSPESLERTFGFGLNQSYLINDSGDIVIHPEFDLVRGGMNVADRSIIQEINGSTERNRQILADADFGFDSSWIASRPDVVQDALALFNIAVDTVFDFLERAGIEKAIPFRRTVSGNTIQSESPETVRLFVAYTKLNIGGSTLITNIEYDRVFEGIATTTRRNIYLTIVVLLISIMLIWFFAKSISVPIKMLAVAARSIEGGTFDLDLNPKGRDEVGLLTNSFRKMSTALGIFGRFTNRDIAVRAMRGEIKPGGLPKHATIFFSDIRGFTAKSENFTREFGEEASDRIVY